MYRLGHLAEQHLPEQQLLEQCLSEQHWVEHSYPAVFQVCAFGDGQRLVGGVPGSDPEVILALARCLAEPLIVLYVLHTGRGGEQEGRYQSPALALQAVTGFIDEFKSYLSSDGRFDLWLYSPGQQATVVWDRHNLLYAYGPLEDYARALRALGFSHGEPQLPVPHTHHYHRQQDEMSRQILERFDWSYSPLRPEDEQ